MGLKIRYVNDNTASEELKKKYLGFIVIIKTLSRITHGGYYIEH